MGPSIHSQWMTLSAVSLDGAKTMRVLIQIWLVTEQSVFMLVGEDELFVQFVSVCLSCVGETFT